MRQIRFAYIILWLSLAWLCPAQSQPPQEPPPALGEFPYYEPNLEAKQAASLAARGKLAEAVAAYIAIADANPRTILGVESLFSAAQLVDTVEESNKILQRIIEEYQNSRFEIFAEFTLVGRNLSPSLSFQEKMVALDGFVQQVGGPSVDSILNATDHRPLLAQFSALPIETQLGLGGVYHDFFDGLHRPERIDDAIRLAQFNQDAFAHAEWTLMHSFRKDLLWALLTKKGAQGVHTIPPQDPVVIPVYPAPNSVVGSAFTLNFKVEGGDFRQTNLDAEPRVSLDGQEVTLGTVHLENNLNLEENVPYETLHVIVELENLSPGLHEISVTAQIQGYDNSGLGRIDHTWAFTVSGAPPGPTTETLPATKDAIIDNFDPNGNEGANRGAGQRRKILLQGTAESDMARALCLNACAYDAQYYYYMPFDAVTKGRDDPAKPPRPIHRIARADWNTELSRLEWTQTPKDKISFPVTIPQAQVGGP